MEQVVYKTNTFIRKPICNLEKQYQRDSKPITRFSHILHRLLQMINWVKVERWTMGKILRQLPFYFSKRHRLFKSTVVLCKSFRVESVFLKSCYSFSFIYIFQHNFRGVGYHFKAIEFWRSNHILPLPLVAVRSYTVGHLWHFNCIIESSQMLLLVLLLQTPHLSSILNDSLSIEHKWGFVLCLQILYGYFTMLATVSFLLSTF